MEYYKIHKAASLVPLPTEKEQVALRDDIEINGQQVPISLYRGKIVDGRSRQNACISLGITVDAEELPNNMSLKEVESFVKSVNTRRNLTRVQKAIIAMQTAMKEIKPNLSEQARRWGIEQSEVSNAKYIQEHRPEYINILYNGGSLEYKDHKTGLLKKGTSLYPIRKSIETAIIDILANDNFIENNGNIVIARAFEQIRATVKFLPVELTSKETKFVLEQVAREVTENKEYEETKEQIHS